MRISSQNGKRLFHRAGAPFIAITDTRDFRSALFTPPQSVFFSRVIQLIRSALSRANISVGPNTLNQAVDLITQALSALSPDSISLPASSVQSKVMAALQRVAFSQDFAADVKQVIVVDKKNGLDRTTEDWCTDTVTKFAERAVKEVALLLGLDDTHLSFIESTLATQFVMTPLAQEELPSFAPSTPEASLFMRDYLDHLLSELKLFLPVDSKAPFLSYSAILRTHLSDVVNFRVIDTQRAGLTQPPLFADVKDAATFKTACNQLAAAFQAQRDTLGEKNSLLAEVKHSALSAVRSARVAAVPLQQPSLPPQTARKTPNGSPIRPPAPQPPLAVVAAAQPESTNRPLRRSLSQTFQSVSSVIAAREQERKASGEWPSDHPHGTKQGKCSAMFDGQMCGSTDHCKYDCDHYSCPLCGDPKPGHAAMANGKSFCPHHPDATGSGF